MAAHTYNPGTKFQVIVDWSETVPIKDPIGVFISSEHWSMPSATAVTSLTLPPVPEDPVSFPDL